MNKQCYRIVFNEVRGMLMAVAETATARSKGDGPAAGACGGASSARQGGRGFAIRGLNWALWLALGMVGLPAQAQIAVDPSAPANQRPTLLNAPNGVPLVNIQTPSAAGVSRNTYRQFDVQTNGAILNNSRTDVQTQLGGWVQGNPWLAAGSARVILNEVNSSDPSLLRGYVEVAGQRAQVVIANPSGVTCDGCGFINTQRTTLTTGTPIMNGGNLEGYRVQGGTVTVAGAGLDASTADYTDLIGRAVQVNAGIWTNHLKVTAGANQVDAANASATPIAGTGAAPAFAIDVAQLGGMYAGKITLVGTEAGVGVRNAGHIGASAGDVVVTAAGRLENSGKMVASDTLRASAVDIDNAAGAEMAAVATRLQAHDTLANRGLIDGGETRIDAGVLDNLGTGRIYGDQLSIQAATLNNVAAGGEAPVIAARSRLDIGAGTINNREHALLFSAGDMAIGGSLDANGQATGQADTLNNASATIEALGGLEIGARTINNTNEHFSTMVENLPPESIVEYQGAGSPNRYVPGTPDVYIYNDESDHLHTPEGNYESWSSYNYTRNTSVTRVASTDPAQILSGGAMRLTADSLLNDKSRIVAGGTLTGNLGSLTNTEATGERIVTDAGTVTSYWRDHQKGRDSTGSSTAAYNPAAAIQTITLAPATYQQNTAAAGSGFQAGTPGTLSSSSLFRANPDPAGSYLVETDPRFANYRQWLSSDYLLNALSADPSALQKRLGDGFYEQKLIREQVAQLTGRRFLDGYANDEAQYRALLDNAVTYAQAHGLVPGVALTAAQMAALTSDIVWLVEKEVTLADGSKAKALVPQLYVRVREGDVRADGALIAGQDVKLDVAGDLINGGTIAGRNVVSLSAENLRNQGGRILGESVAAQARTDLDNIGGTFAATDSLAVAAGRDLSVVSTTRTQSNAQGSRTNLDRVAGLYVTGSGGTLLASAGRDANLIAAAIQNQGSGETRLLAGNDLTLGTVTESASNRIVWDGNNRRSDARSADIGSRIATQGDLTLAAGNDLAARAADVQANGALAALAGRDIRLESGQANVQVDEAHRHSSKGFLSKKTVSTRDTLDQTRALGTTLGGATVALQSGRDLGIQGGSVVGDSGTTLVAGRDITIEAAQETRQETHFRQETKSGLFSSGGFGVTLGKREQSLDRQGQSTTAAAATVGAVAGDVRIQAGETYRQTGSDVLAPGGDIAIAAKTIDIVEARETRQERVEQKFKQSGLTVAISNPVVTAVQTAQAMADAAKDTDDPRMQALAAANTALAAKTAYDAVKAGQGDANGKIPTGKTNPDGTQEMRDATAADKLGGIGINVSLGSSKSQSSSTQSSDSARGSTLTAGQDITLVATGAEQASDLTLQGAQVQAGRNLLLAAEDEIRLLAAKNTATLQSDNQSSSGSLGVGYNTSSGFSVTASASKGKGNASGDDLSHQNTKLGAGDTAHLIAGTDARLQGAIVEAPRIAADVGGDLKIESLQDSSTYASRQNSAGFSLSVPIGGGMPGGSVSGGKSKIDSTYASVNEQSGLKAGDGGFQIDVQGDTALIGGAITSTQQAIDQDNNRFQTGGTLTLADLENKAEYQGKAASLAIGTGFDPQGKLVPQGTSAGVGEKSGSAQSMTLAAISGIAGNQDARTGDKETGLQKIFDADKVQKEIDAQVKITQMFGQQASQAIGEYAKGKLEEAAAKQTAAQIKTLQADAAERAGDTDRAGQLRTDAQLLEGEAATHRDLWGETGSARIGLHALVAGLTGDIDGVAGSLASSLTLPEIKAQLDQTDLSDTAKQAVLEATSLGIGAATGGTQGAAGALNEAANNYLTSLQEMARDKELAACKTLACTTAVKMKYGLVSLNQDAGQAIGVVGGAVYQGGELVVAMVDMVKNLPETLKALEAIVNDPEFRAKVGDAIANDYKTRIEMQTSAYNDGGWDGSVTSGVEAGRLAVDIVGVATAAVGVSKVVATTAKAGVSVGTKALENAAIQLMKWDAGAIKGFKSADELNAAMLEANKSLSPSQAWAPAWKPGTAVAETTLQPGTKVRMVVDETTYLNYVNSGKTDISFGGWATFDNVPNQAYARNQLAITSDMKSNVGYVLEVEVTRPINAHVGVVGAQRTATGGGNQLHFIIQPQDRASVFKVVGERKL